MFVSNKAVLVVGSSMYAKAIKGLFAEITNNKHKFFSSPNLFGMVLFTGGADVSPYLYEDESPLLYCENNESRDKEEVALWNHAMKNKIKMTGICRGAQFLNVMAGGKLLHHLHGHEIKSHNFVTSKIGFDKPIKVNSLHHQMIIPPKDGFIIGWSPEKLSSDGYIGYHDKPANWPGPEVEAMFMPSTKSCGVQYHPEMMEEDSDGYKFYRNMVKDMITMDTTEFITVYTGAKKSNNLMG